MADMPFLVPLMTEVGFEPQLRGTEPIAFTT